MKNAPRIVTKARKAAQAYVLDQRNDAALIAKGYTARELQSIRNRNR